MASDLVYVIGPAGSGKDTLLNHLRASHGAQPPTVVAHRYITRPASARGENHIALDTSAFRDRERLGCFALTWVRDGIHYGIGREIDLWLAEGINVIVNGSRGALSDAAARYGDQLRPVLLDLASDKRRERLLARGREDATEIADRLARDRAFPELNHSRLIELDAGLSPDALAHTLLKRLANEPLPCD